jgi:pre-mRNA-processing factor 6
MVFILLPNGKSFALDVNPNATTLHHLKAAIEQHHCTPVLNQCLFLSQSLGENDSNLISNLGIGPFSTLTLHIPFFGGTPTPSDIRSAEEEASSATSKSDSKKPKRMPKKKRDRAKKRALAKNANGNAAPIPDAIAVASNGKGRGKGAVKAKDEDTEVKNEEEKKEANEVKGIADREEVDTDSETDEANKPEGEFKLVNEKSKERFMKVFGSVGKAMSREKVENQFDTIPVTEGISDEFDAQIAAKRNARIQMACH